MLLSCAPCVRRGATLLIAALLLGFGPHLIVGTADGRSARRASTTLSSDSSSLLQRTAKSRRALSTQEAQLSRLEASVAGNRSGLDAARTEVAATALQFVQSPAIATGWNAPSPSPGKKLLRRNGQHAVAESRVATAGSVSAAQKGPTPEDMDDGPPPALDINSLFWLFTGIMPSVVISMIIFEIVHRRWSDTDSNLELDYTDLGRAQDTSVLRLCDGAWVLAKPCIFGPQAKPKIRVYLFVILAMGLFNLFLDYCFNIWQSLFWSAFKKKDGHVFVQLVALFFLIAFSSIIVSTYETYIRQIVQIHMREILTSRFQAQMFYREAFYKMQIDQQKGDQWIDNPDQRLQVDVTRFVEMSLDLTFGVFQAIGTLLVFGPLLAKLSPPYIFETKAYCPGWLAIAMIIFALIGSVLSHVIGKQLVNIEFGQQRYEADFRYRIVQVRDHAEQIALAGASEAEQDGLNGSFEYVKRIWWERMYTRKKLGFFTSFFSQVAYLVPFFLMAPSYFAGTIGMGRFFQISHASGQVNDSLHFMVHNYGLLADYRAVVIRLTNFTTAMEAIGKLPVVQRSIAGQARPTIPRTAQQEAEENLEEDANTAVDNGAQAFRATGLCASLPDGTPLWSDVDLNVSAGEKVLLVAPEGTGKSAFFRAVASIWPYGARGTCFYSEQPFFVPQRAYVPQGELRRAVAFPKCPGTYTDEDIVQVLTEVGLATKLPVHDLSMSANWGEMLSGGELQRFAIARVLLAKPRVLFLDEVTSSLGPESARELYNLLWQQLPKGAVVVSIAHQVDVLLPFHDRCLTAKAPGLVSPEMEVEEPEVVVSEAYVAERKTGQRWCERPI